MFKVLLLGVFSALLVACSSGTLNWPSGYHVVQRGDTLFSISWQYGLDYRELAAWNNLGDGTLIYVGQSISLVPLEGSDISTSSGSTSGLASKTTNKSKPLPPYKPPPEQKVNGWQ